MGAPSVLDEMLEFPQDTFSSTKYSRACQIWSRLTRERNVARSWKSCNYIVSNLFHHCKMLGSECRPTFRSIAYLWPTIVNVLGISRCDFSQLFVEEKNCQNGCFFFKVTHQIPQQFNSNNSKSPENLPAIPICLWLSVLWVYSRLFPPHRAQLIHPFSYPDGRESKKELMFCR